MGTETQDDILGLLKPGEEEEMLNASQELDLDDPDLIPTSRARKQTPLKRDRSISRSLKVVFGTGG
jgi:hypothetical protein